MFNKNRNYNNSNRYNRNGNNNNRSRNAFKKNNYNVRNLTKVKGENIAEDVKKPEALEMGKLRVIPLGGVERVGLNTTVFEYENDMIIVDMGFGFPDDKQSGIDYVIPNYEYVKENISKLRGIVITHGHLDHIGAIPFVIKELGNPIIYAGKLSAELIREKAQEFALEDEIKIQEVTSVSKYRLGVFEISYFRVNHNIPDSFGCMIKTPVGNIVHTGDFKFDLTPYREPVTEFSKIADIGEEGVLLLLSDSTNACKEGWSESETSVTHDLSRIINEAKGRVITATFSTLITRMAQIVEIAHAANRKVVITGRSIETQIRIAKELGLIKVPWEAFITKDQAQHIPDDNLLIMATGTQGEEKAALNRMAMGIHNNFDIKQGDTVILSSSFIPGNEGKINDVIAKLTKKGAMVYHSQMMDVHAGGHAHVEDHKLLLHLCKPKFLMPIHGEYLFLLGQRNTAVKVGMDINNVILTENGTTVDFDANTYNVAGKVNAMPILVDGYVMGDITPEILMDRQTLGDEGIVLVVVSGSDINVITRGCFEVRENQAVIDGIKSIVSNQTENVSKLVSDFITEKIGRSPIVEVVKK